MLRERLGENAKVLSVRQVEGAGLARFLRAPKLEIIAEAGEEVEEFLPVDPLMPGGPVEPRKPPAIKPVKAPAHRFEALPKEEDDIADEVPYQAPHPAPSQELGGTPPVPVAVPRSQIQAILRNVAEAQGSEIGAKSVASPEVSLPPPERKEPPARSDATPTTDLARILQKGGVPDSLLARIKSGKRWLFISQLPVVEALNEVAGLLRQEFEALPKRPTGRCIAFLGTPGVGKTTALCKRLAMEVFFKQKRAVVLKVDMDTANSGEALSIFCEALGVPMVRSLDSVPPLGNDEALYIDCPGIGCSNTEELNGLSKLLSSMAATSRVLVINAAYDAGLIKKAYQMGSHLKATHVVFTHLDELSQWGKLWEFVLASDLTPLFLSSGQNIAGDFSESVFESILQRSFPMVGKETAMQASAI